MLNNTHNLKILKVSALKDAVALSCWLNGTLELSAKKRILFTIVVDKITLNIYTNGIIEGAPKEWQNIQAINYFPSIIAERLALIPDELLSEHRITGKK